MAERFTQVADGVLRMGTALINWYLVADDAGVTVVDAGATAHHSQLEPGLAQLGRGLDDVRAVILTHGDGDHKGFAERVREQQGVPVHVHGADAELTRTGQGRSREASVLPYLRYPAAWKIMVALARGGRPLNVAEVETFEDGDVLDVPGRPRVVLAAGHTPGSVVFHFERAGALVVGDVLFEYNVLTGRRGPQISPAALNESSDQAMASLERIEPIDADVILFGHGDPWREGPAAAVAAARRAGPS